MADPAGSASSRSGLPTVGATTALVFGLLPVLAVVFTASGGFQWLPHLLAPDAQGFEDLGVVILAIFAATALFVLGGAVAVIVGAVVLGRIRAGRSAGQGRAIAAVVLGGVWLLIVLAIALRAAGVLQLPFA